MRRGTSEDLLTDCITHRPPQRTTAYQLAMSACERQADTSKRALAQGESGTAWVERSVQEIGQQAVGVVGELAVIDGLAFLEDQEAGEGGDGVLLREDAVAVEEDRDSQRPAGEEGLDGGAVLLEVD